MKFGTRVETTACGLLQSLQPDCRPNAPNHEYASAWT